VDLGLSDGSRAVAFDVEPIVDEQLFADHDVSERPDKHATPLLLCLTVRLAAMVKPACRIATTPAVDDVSVIQSEEKRVTILGAVALIALARDAPGCHFTFVFNEYLPGLDVG
jgi:hypothetical protein